MDPKQIQRFKFSNDKIRPAFMGVETRIEAGNWYLDTRKNMLQASTASIVTSIHNFKQGYGRLVRQLSRILYKSDLFYSKQSQFRKKSNGCKIKYIKEL